MVPVYRHYTNSKKYEYLRTLGRGEMIEVMNHKPITEKSYVFVHVWLQFGGFETTALMDWSEV